MSQLLRSIFVEQARWSVEQTSGDRPLGTISYDIITQNEWMSFVCENLAAGGRVVYEASVDGTESWVARCPVHTVHTSSIVQTPAVDAAVGACHHLPKDIVQTGFVCVHFSCTKAVCLLWCLKSCFFIGSWKHFCLSFLEQFYLLHLGSRCLNITLCPSPVHLSPRELLKSQFSSQELVCGVRLKLRTLTAVRPNFPEPQWSHLCRRDGVPLSWDYSEKWNTRSWLHFWCTIIAE